MFLFHHLMQGSLLLPHSVSQQSLAVLQSAKSITPELVWACYIRPSPTRLSCKLKGNLDRQDYPGRSAGADSVCEFRSSRRVAAQGLSAADKGFRKMPGNSFVRFSHCSYCSSLAPSVFHRSVAIHGQSLDYSPWKSIVSGLPQPVLHYPAKAWYCIPSRALRGLKTTHYGAVTGKRAGHDFLSRERDKGCEKKSDVYSTGSEKGWISACSRFEGGRGNLKKTFAEESVTVSDEDSDSESDEDETNRKHMRVNKLKCKEEEEDIESDSDDEKEMHKMKKCASKSKVEEIGMSEDDSESPSDEEKEMRKKMKADKKELKKQAKEEKKGLKAIKTVECEDSESEDDDKEEEKKQQQQKEKEKRKEKVVAVFKDKHQIPQPQYLGQRYSGSENDAEEGDVVEEVSRALGDDEGEEQDFELIEDENLNDEIESEIEAAFEDFEDEDQDDDFWEEEEGETRVGDGGDGGGVVLGESLWENKALELAQIVVKELGTDFAIYAFKASPDGLVRVRIDKLSDQFGSPTMTEIETFSRKYSEILESSEIIPDSVAIEVSSPGAERIVKIPDELERFKLLPMYVQYFEDESGNEEKDGVLELESIDSGSGMTIWKLANVKFNREQSGKGRPLNSKQRKWRAHVPLNSLQLVRLYLDV